jgi:hypothetical protein
VIKKNWTKQLSILAITLSISAIVLGIFIMAKTLPSNTENEYRSIVKQNYQNFAAPIPDKVEFCGKEIPLDNVFVREALDRELTAIMYHHSTTFLILKRAPRYFPIIESILEKEGVPDDIKYLAVAESGLANVVSPSKAEGIWQFLLSTSKEYGLDTLDGWDERYDLEKSTLAATKYLKEKKEVFSDWALACAAYNSGERAVRTRLNDQGCNNYWDLYTNTETSRYVYRIIAYKLVMENPQQYGYYFRKKDTYQPIPTTEIIIDTTINDLYAFANQMGVKYSHFRNLNPAIRASRIHNKNNKKLRIYIPEKDALSWKQLTKDLKHEQIEIK